MARLGDVCVKKVDTIKATYKGNIDYIDISSVDNQCKEIKKIQSMAIEDAPSRAKQLVLPGDILVSTVRPNLNAVALITKDSDNILVASTGYCVLRCLPNADNKYVFHFCQSPTFIEKLVAQATGASYPAVTSAIVKECTLPLPPLDEQRKIAAVLDKVSDLIAQRRKQMDKLDELVKARFSELLSVIDCIHSAEPLENYLENITYGFTNPMPDSKEGPWKITAKDIADRKINFSTARKTTTEAFEGLTEKSKPLIDDVLLTKDGTLGRMAIVEDANICVNQSVAVLRCNKRVMPKILMYLLQMPEYQQKMISNAGGGTIKHIYITKVGKMLVNIPNIETQKAFLYFAEQTEKTKTTISRSLEKLETLKKALMQEYFG